MTIQNDCIVKCLKDYSDYYKQKYGSNELSGPILYKPSKF